MKIWLKTVTRDWADVVEKLASPETVNVWQGIEPKDERGRPRR